MSPSRKVAAVALAEAVVVAGPEAAVLAQREEALTATVVAVSEAPSSLAWFQCWQGV